MTRSVQFMNNDLYEKIISEAAALGMHNLDLRNFGEPLLDPFLAEKSAFAAARGFNYIFFPTNGFLLTPEKYLQLRGGGVRQFIISLSPKREFDATRGTDLYETILANLKRISLLCNFGDITIDYINTGNSSASEIQEFKTTIEGMGYGIREEIQLHNWAHGSETYETDEIKFCHRLWNSFTVLADGKVALCCLDYNGENIVGDMNEQSIESVINGEAYQYYRRGQIEKNLKGLCKHCNMTHIKY